MSEDDVRLVVGSIYGAQTKQGLVELVLTKGGETMKLQMDLDKAREVLGMLSGAIEAAVDPELLTREQLLQLIELVKMGQGLIPNPELEHEPPRLQAGEQIVDAEVEVA